MDEDQTSPGGKPRYRWPWFVLALLLLGAALAILWVSIAALHVRAERESTSLPSPVAAPR